MKYIEENKLSINIICVPVANPFALDSQIMWLQTGYNNIHTNTYNCINYNRIWENNSQLFESELNNILLDISQSADVVIDLHSAWYESLEHMYCHEKYIDSAKNFWIDNIIYRNESWNAFEDVCYRRWQMSYTLELWASRKTEHQRTQYFLEKILNFLEHQQPSENLLTYDITWLRTKIFADNAWILVWEKSVWDYINKWDKLGVIYNTDWKHDLISIHEWIFLIKNSIHAPYKNQDIGQILSKLHK
jgi:predicted deacylase